MTINNNHNRKDSDFENLMHRFSKEERKEVEEVWRFSKKTRHREHLSSDEEIEEALQNVHFRIDEKKKSEKKGTNISGFILTNARYLVAAVALIVLGFGFFMVPKTIFVPNAEIAVIELPDGSSVEMNSGSTLRYNRLFGYINRSLTLNGEAYFSVREGKNPFIVEANGSAIEVTGTEFNVRSWSTDPGSETTVTVTEGNVAFYLAGNQSTNVSLMAGQTSRLNIKMSSPTQPVASTDEHLAWLEKRMVFQEEPLIVILHDLERNFDVEIELEAEKMEYETLTAYYNQPANIETILEDICTVKGLRYTKTSNGYRIYK